ncbi:MAG: hypothetical protein JWO20_445 [Candidatus Angelobacter sp.]|jgi:hypothetical protein|nr:hypothetical protein [Candidatus Angelobacter sp.]
MKVSNSYAWFLTIASLCLLVSGCATKVSTDKVSGTYLASYPFGSEQLTLNPNGTFVQKVVLNGEEPAEQQGSWIFDPETSYVTFRNLAVVADGFGNRIDNWRNSKPIASSLPVERFYFKIRISDSAKFPYTKQ